MVVSGLMGMVYGGGGGDLVVGVASGRGGGVWAGGEDRCWGALVFGSSRSSLLSCGEIK